MGRWVLGIDGGNSKTLAFVVDPDGGVVGIGRAGGSSHQSAGLETAMANLQLAAAAAAANAQVALDEVDAAYFALAGADLPEDYDLLSDAVGRLGIGRQWKLENDVFAAMRSGTDKPDAAVVILGAGTNAAGWNARGQVARFPALGWISGDWGGAGDIVQEAIRLAVRASDGRGQPTVLAATLPEAMSLPDTDAITRALYHRRYPEGGLLSLAPLVFQAAESGDDVARSIIRLQGREAAIMAVTILGRLDLLDREPDVVLAGGLTRTGSRVLLDAIADGIGTAAPDARILLPDLEPAAGSVLLALDLAGIPVTSATRARLLETYRTAVARVSDSA